MKARPLPSGEIIGIQKYEYIRMIGKGMAGAVSVYKNVLDS